MSVRSACVPMFAMLAFSISAQAAPSAYSNLVVFGDSLSDAGQFPDVGGPLGASLRFTNRVGPTYQPGNGEVIGPTSVMLLGSRLGFSAQTLGPSTSPTNAVLGLPDGNNWAVGGYRTDQIYDSITAENGSVVSVSGITLRQRDGYLVELAEQGARIDPDTLFYLSGGGNDFLQGLITSPATAAASADQLAASVSALQQAGGQYFMVWLLPDLGLTPDINGTAQQSGASLLSNVFNTELVARLSMIEANIIPLNVPLLLNEVLADPATYGLAADQDLTGTCFDDCDNPSTTYGLNGTTPDPTRLLYNDSVHPTSTGQRLIADYAYSLLAAPWELTLLPEMAYGSLTGHQRQLQAEWASDRYRWQAIGQWRGFISPGGFRQDLDSQSASTDGNNDGYSLDLGGSYRVNKSWRLGIAAGLYRQTLETGASDSEYDLRSYFATAFAQYQQGRWWADLSLSGGYLDYNDLQRTFSLGPAERSEKGDTRGQLWAAGGRLGFDLATPQGAWHLSPYISADYARIEVDGYLEQSQRSTALAVDDQTRRSRRLGAGVEGQAVLGAATQLFLDVAREKEFEDNAADLALSQRAVPTLRYTLAGYRPSDRLDRVSLGVRQQLSEDLSLRANYSYSKAREGDSQQAVGLSLAWQW
ncbi:outer membrane lipase/esterase [Pseudomonas duriflava]|uniref:Outer membrane lipase/esterase n=1 Tax=Pseudomonas duriflava TaxID=459528 RepID=A0A562QDI9_9PSED|nr:autotransporter domain-containing SGNH/GDSL hydrolase family protein [Pseudomonas duriflava]TWI54835.1 outer membrane lipase/esterase [Pseudomonas duriflava]